MTKPTTDDGASLSREDRLAQRLRDNLRRRKRSSADRASDAPDADDGGST